MAIQITPVLPFLAARLNIGVQDLLTMPADTVCRIFGRHTLLFLDECARNPSRIESLTEAERAAYPSIAEVAKLVGIGAS